MLNERCMTPEQAKRLADTLTTLTPPFTVTVREGVIRSNPQNDLMWKWNEEVQQRFPSQFHDAKDVHRDNKLLIGCRICMRDESFRMVAECLKGLTYEQKLEAMDILPVTSRMTKAEMTEYLDLVHKKWTGRGVKLTNPEEA